jgi:hypothetical protein
MLRFRIYSEDVNFLLEIRRDPLDRKLARSVTTGSVIYFLITSEVWVPCCVAVKLL